MPFFGTGASASGVSSSKTVRYSREDLGMLVLDVCEKEKRGLLLTIDEIQKLDLDDVAAICDAFQMASRKGFDAMLAVAGLPYAHQSVIQHEGCTYLRRAVHESLRPLAPEEVRAAYTEAFAVLGGLAVGKEELEALVNASKGHPYIMQLLGYYLVDSLRADAEHGAMVVTDAAVEQAVLKARSAYAQRAVKPIVDALGEAEVAYLRAMSRVISSDRRAKTNDIAHELGKTQQQTSRARQRLIDNGILLAASHGYVVFGIPYLDDYLLSNTDENRDVESRMAWRY